MKRRIAANPLFGKESEVSQMKLVIDGNIKEFDNAQVEAAGEKCRALCEGCDIGLEECLLGTRDCPVKNAVESINAMIRMGRGIKRYRELKGLEE